MRENFVRRRLPTLDEIIRKNTTSIFARFTSSENAISADVNHMITNVTFIGQTFFPRIY